jgi:hypothetical protein
MSTWFDLQRAIIADFRQSVAVSFAVVLVFAALVLRSKAVCAVICIAAVDVCTVILCFLKIKFFKINYNFVFKFL